MPVDPQVDAPARAILFARKSMRRSLQEDIEDPSQADFANMGKALRESAQNPDPNEYDVLVTLSADLLRQNEVMPGWLKSFAADVLTGERRRPTKRGPDPYARWDRDYRLWRAVRDVAHACSVPHYSNNELSSKVTAASIVSVATEHPVDTIVKAYQKLDRHYRKLEGEE